MITPANRPYEPFGAAKDVWTDRSDEVLLSGPAGTGKSRACLESSTPSACAGRERDA